MLNQDYKEMLQILQKHNVNYILVGAYALAAQGYPRSTLDIDIWVNPNKDNSSNIYKALVEFGAPLEDINEDTFKEKGIVFQIGVAPCRINIITEISGGIEFKDAISRSIKTEIEGVSLNILSLWPVRPTGWKRIEDLIKNKVAIGRLPARRAIQLGEPKDIEDAKMLKNRL